MDLGNRGNREANTRETAGWLSVITFFYNYKVLKKGKKKDLEEPDIYRVLPAFQAETLGNKLEEQWREGRKSGEKLWITLSKCFGLTYLIYAIVQLGFGTTIILYQPKAFSKFVAYFDPTQTTITTWDACLYAGAIFGFLFLNALYLHNLAQLVTEYSMKVRTAVCSLIFRKALRLSPGAFEEISVGKIVTLISKDVYAIDAALSFIKDMAIGLLQLGVVTGILYERVGYSAFPPVVVIVLIIPIQLICGRVASKVRLKTAKSTDERFQLTQEALSSIKIIKMLNWQAYFEKLVTKARVTETQKLAIVYYLKALIGWLGAFTINIAFYILLLCYIIQGHALEAETVYFVQQCLFALRLAIMVSIPMGICNTADLVAAFQRIQSFLEADEVPIIIGQPLLPLKTAAPKVHLNKAKVADVKSNRTVLKSVSLSLDNDGDGSLLIVTGSLGSGKSVLLKTISGEYRLVAGHMQVQGTMSFAPEEPWIFPSTIRQNILFGEPHKPGRYQEVLHVCALVHDLNKLENLDETFVGDKGLNLSKGQQARVSLARAIYRESDIYLLDDCLSCLDNNVSDHIFRQCIQGFLRNKICIFVTNKVHLLGGNNVLFLEKGSTLTVEQQSKNKGLDKRITYYIDEEVNNILTNKARESSFIHDNDFDEHDELLLTKKNDNSCMKEINDDVYKEKKKEGSVLWSNYVTYGRLMGGSLVFLYLLVAFAAAQAALSFSEKLVSVWVNLKPQIATYKSNTTQYEESLKSREYYLNLYTILIVIAMIISLVRSYSVFYACLNAARTLHNQLISAILRAQMTFFDSHFIGNIINRLSKDFYVVDEYMPFFIFDILRLIFSFIGVIVLVASVNWLLLVPGVFLVIKLYFVQRFYLPTGRSLRRLEASSRSPVIGYLNATLEGLSVIRTSQQEIKVRSEFDRHQDLYTSAYYMNQTTMRFFAFLLDLFGVFFVMGILSKLLVFTEGETAGDVGLVVSQAMLLSGILQYAIKQTAELENVMTSVERILEYAGTKPEKSTSVAKASSDWPDVKVNVKGAIEFQNVSLSYKDNKVKALKDVSFKVLAGSKVGIVGRTGAGKSSIISSLFRLYDIQQGAIFVDDVDINTLPLNVLRSTITLIPQDPVIFSGSVRSNIDPFNKFSDQTIWAVLERVHLKSKLVASNLLDLDSCSYSSHSFSSGERQLLCLARALIQQNNIIVLDEATASLDPDTDLLLQKTIQDCFGRCTVIIISHKPRSVMWCDKVLTLKDGCVGEFEEPRDLLEDREGLCLS